jgi:hypothetical protein
MLHLYPTTNPERLFQLGDYDYNHSSAMGPHRCRYALAEPLAEGIESSSAIAAPRSPAWFTGIRSGLSSRPAQRSWIDSSDTAVRCVVTQLVTHRAAAGGSAARNQLLAWWAILGSNQ